MNPKWQLQTRFVSSQQNERTAAATFLGTISIIYFKRLGNGWRASYYKIRNGPWLACDIAVPANYFSPFYQSRLIDPNPQRAKSLEV
jgi:hypothetical protein